MARAERTRIRHVHLHYGIAGRLESREEGGKRVGAAVGPKAQAFGEDDVNHRRDGLCTKGPRNGAEKKDVSQSDQDEQDE